MCPPLSPQLAALGRHRALLVRQPGVQPHVESIPVPALVPGGAGWGRAGALPALTVGSKLNGRPVSLARACSLDVILRKG